jgi:hypothetical protein
MDSLKSGRGLVPGHLTTTAMKKPYRPPKLIVYGDLTEMTQSKEGGMRMSDGGATAGMMKT